MCCACGGGATTEISMPLPESICEDEDNGIVDSFGDGCDYYYDEKQATFCGAFDTETFKANEMCCGCGGGFNPLTDGVVFSAKHIEQGSFL